MSDNSPTHEQIKEVKSHLQVQIKDYPGAMRERAYEIFCELVAAYEAEKSRRGCLENGLNDARSRAEQAEAALDQARLKIDELHDARAREARGLDEAHKQLRLLDEKKQEWHMEASKWAAAWDKRDKETRQLQELLETLAKTLEQIRGCYRDPTGKFGIECPVPVSLRDEIDSALGKLYAERENRTIR